MLYLCYPKCSTCGKAKKWLDEHTVLYTERNIKENNPTYEELTTWYKKSNVPLKKFFNTSGLLYKSLQLKDKLSSMTEDEQLHLLATDGMLVKRPLLIGDDFVLLGFKANDWGETLN
ncbi:MAG: arsenate reductase family protein [Treponemataceae bacterium]